MQIEVNFYFKTEHLQRRLETHVFDGPLYSENALYLTNKNILPKTGLEKWPINTHQGGDFSGSS